MATLKKITSLESFEKDVACTAKTTEVRDENGQRTGVLEDNPHYLLAARRLDAARYHFDATNKIVASAKAKGFIRNQYDKTCVVTGEPVKAFTGFSKKDESGKWATYSWDSVVEILGVQIVDLPVIE